MLQTAIAARVVPLSSPFSPTWSQTYAYWHTAIGASVGTVPRGQRPGSKPASVSGCRCCALTCSVPRPTPRIHVRHWSYSDSPSGPDEPPHPAAAASINVPMASTEAPAARLDVLLLHLRALAVGVDHHPHELLEANPR